MLSFFFGLLSFSISAAPLGLDEAWQDFSHPLIMTPDYESRVFMLPTEGSAERPETYWSADYWPMSKGSINFRWNASRSFKEKSPDKERAFKMTLAELSQLSPAEKFDLFTGRYYYPLKNEVIKLTNYSSQNWEGICHGWAPAAINHKEPTPKNVTNPDGLIIPFGSADIKAILSYYYAYPYQVSSTYQMGRRCESMRSSDPDCKQDLNAGAFHLILANKIGLRGEGFVADIDRFEQVWNQPIMSYKSMIVSQGPRRNDSAPDAVKVFTLSTVITYADESRNLWTPLLGTTAQKFKSQTFNYLVEVNDQGQIVGGEWLSQKRPDFVWLKEKPRKFIGNFIKLAELLND